MTRMTLEGLAEATRYLDPSVHLRDLVARARHGPDAPRIAERLHVAPRAIRTALRPTASGRLELSRRDSGKVIGGDWDLRVMPLDEMDKIAVLNRRYRDGVDWHEAGGVALMMELIAKRGVCDGCRTLPEVEARYRGVDRLHAELSASRSMRTRAELLGLSFREKRGIYVHIGRDGQPIFGGGGCHRLGIARLLDLDRIPVQVGAVHPLAIAHGAYGALRGGKGLARTQQP